MRNRQISRKRIASSESGKKLKVKFYELGLEKK